MTIHQFFIKQSQVGENSTVTLEGSDARHIRLVLRLKKGNRIRLVDDEQNLHEADIEEVTDRSVLARIVETRDAGVDSPFTRRLTVVQGIPRLPKADLIVRQLTELGAERIVFVPTERSPYPDAHRRLEARLDRLRRIAAEASKQCSRRGVPEVALKGDLGAAVEAFGAETVLLTADESAPGARLRDRFPQCAPDTPVAVFIGPEGGFSGTETHLLADAGATVFSLGRNILRTETAALIAAALILYEMGEI